MQSASLIHLPRTNFPHYRNTRSAFSLVEIMVSLGMMAIVSVGLVLGQLQSNRLAGKARSINSAKVILRQMVDRFQTVSKGDELLDESTSFASDTKMGLTDCDPGTTGIQVILFDEDPDSNGYTGSANKLFGTIERKVVYAAGTSTTVSALANVTFRITYREYGSRVNGVPSDTVLEMSTNRATP